MAGVYLILQRKGTDLRYVGWRAEVKRGDRCSTRTFGVSIYGYDTAYRYAVEFRCAELRIPVPKDLQAPEASPEVARWMRDRGLGVQ